MCGSKGLPADKIQRLPVLLLREARLLKRVRHFLHVPTEIMLADGLTKPEIFHNLMYHLTTGLWDTETSEVITLRRAAEITNEEIDEAILSKPQGNCLVRTHYRQY